MQIVSFDSVELPFQNLSEVQLNTLTVPGILQIHEFDNLDPYSSFAFIYSAPSIFPESF